MGTREFITAPALAFLAWATPAWAVKQSTPLQAEAFFEDAVAKNKGEGAVDYVWRNPVNNRVENKQSFVRRVDNYILGVGCYRD